MLRILVFILGITFISPMMLETARADSFYIGPYGMGFSIGEPNYVIGITPTPLFNPWYIVPPPPPHRGFYHRPAPRHRDFHSRPAPHHGGQHFYPHRGGFGYRPPPHHR